MKNIFKAVALSNHFFKSAIALTFLLLVAFVTSSPDVQLNRDNPMGGNQNPPRGVTLANSDVGSDIGGAQSARRNYAFASGGSESIIGGQHAPRAFTLSNAGSPGDIGGTQSAPRPYKLGNTTLPDIGGTGNPPRNYKYVLGVRTDTLTIFDIGGTQSCPRPYALSSLHDYEIGGQGNQGAPRSFQSVGVFIDPIGGHRVPQSGSPIKLDTAASFIAGIVPIGGNSCPRNLKEESALNFAS